MLRKTLIIISITILLLSIVAIVKFPDFSYQYKDLTFIYDGKLITGRLALPDSSNNDVTSFPVAVFIHGDGPVNRTGNDEYLFHWKRLLDEGIACFSWDKQGVGESQGNWEHQSMKDRAQEVISAIEFLKTLPEVGENKIGLIGFSQAGWVMPYVSTLSDYPDFIVSVSVAINVFTQGEYLNDIRLKEIGFSKEERQKYKVIKKSMYTKMANGMSYEEYREFWFQYIAKYQGEDATPISYDRYIFSRNIWPDARDHLKNIECPVLGIFGEEDLNVDIKESVSVYKGEFSNIKHKDYEIKVFTNGTHALLKADKYQYKTPGLIDLILYGEDIFTEGYIELMTSWIKSKT